MKTLPHPPDLVFRPGGRVAYRDRTVTAGSPAWEALKALTRNPDGLPLALLAAAAWGPGPALPPDRVRALVRRCNGTLRRLRCPWAVVVRDGRAALHRPPPPAATTPVRPGGMTTLPHFQPRTPVTPPTRRAFLTAAPAVMAASAPPPPARRPDWLDPVALAAKQNSPAEADLRVLGGLLATAAHLADVIADEHSDGDCHCPFCVMDPHAGVMADLQHFSWALDRMSDEVAGVLGRRVPLSGATYGDDLRRLAAASDAADAHPGRKPQDH